LGNLLAILLAHQLSTTKQCSTRLCAHPAERDLCDASFLLHTFLRVGSELRQPESPKHRLKDVVKEMRQLWKSRMREEVLKREPWKQRVWDEMREHRDEHRPPPARPTTTTRPDLVTQPDPVSLEREELMDELRRAKYGDDMHLVVRDLYGRELDIKFRSLTRLNVLMVTACKRLALRRNETTFMHQDRQIHPDDTPQSFGLEDQDVIEVRSELLDKSRMEELQKREEQARAEMMAAKAEQEALKAKAEREKKAVEQATQREKRQVKMERELDSTQKKMERIKAGLIDLQFIDGNGRKLHVAVKRDIWLGGIMNQVCMRLHMNALKTCFLIEVTHKQIVARDTADLLGLDQDEIIRIKPCEDISDEESWWS